MKKVFYASDLFENKKEEKALKPIEFTHYLNESIGWEDAESILRCYDKVIYLGRCTADGDMFAAYSGGIISIYKGQLNDGVME